MSSIGWVTWQTFFASPALVSNRNHEWYIVADLWHTESSTMASIPSATTAVVLPSFLNFTLPWKILGLEVWRLLFFWEGLFSRAMLVSGRVSSKPPQTSSTARPQRLRPPGVDDTMFFQMPGIHGILVLKIHRCWWIFLEISMNSMHVYVYMCYKRCVSPIAIHCQHLPTTWLSGDIMSEVYATLNFSRQ